MPKIAVLFQSLKGFQRFCGSQSFCPELLVIEVSIPKRVSEVLWLLYKDECSTKVRFQSLKGFQRFCGHGRILDLVVSSFTRFNP